MVKGLKRLLKLSARMTAWSTWSVSSSTLSLLIDGIVNRHQRVGRPSDSYFYTSRARVKSGSNKKWTSLKHESEWLVYKENAQNTTTQRVKREIKGINKAGSLLVKGCCDGSSWKWHQRMGRDRTRSERKLCNIWAKWIRRERTWISEGIKMDRRWKGVSRICHNHNSHSVIK